MSDYLETVRQALDWYENDRPRQLNNWESLDVMADAAGRLVRLAETGPDYEAAERVKACDVRTIVDAALADLTEEE